MQAGLIEVTDALAALTLQGIPAIDPGVGGATAPWPGERSHACVAASGESPLAGRPVGHESKHLDCAPFSS